MTSSGTAPFDSAQAATLLPQSTVFSLKTLPFFPDFPVTYHPSTLFLSLPKDPPIHGSAHRSPQRPSTHPPYGFSIRVLQAMTSP
jgi:hypothetical protein